MLYTSEVSVSAIATQEISSVKRENVIASLALAIALVSEIFSVKVLAIAIALVLTSLV